ncbi:hypothetical protein P8C59_006084 [Phyllachora maydis]|uniref:Yeast cell wall synthesis Kre9/Knh1-like N-terminal domain-containing protein n=1 Tax=Phyllachora maydis TaxID=1825666 RepID=A0AAD9I5T0_9PEZI|nr:hypothetical protein P8C59_006084 [Phyllachora maydis]
MRCFLALSALVAAASAIEILQPDDTSQWDFSSKNTITWKNVSTDPQTFNVVLVNGAATPPSTTVIAQGVNTADDQYSFSNIAAAPGNKYSIEFVGTAAQSSGILAQSKQFNVTKSGANSTSGGSGGSSTGTQSSPTASSTHSSANAATSISGTFCMLAARGSRLSALLIRGLRIRDVSPGFAFKDCLGIHSDPAWKFAEKSYY